MAKERKKRFIEDSIVHVGRHLAIPASEVVQADLQVVPMQITVYAVKDITTDKIWAARFDDEQSAKLVLADMTRGVVEHYRNLLRFDKEDNGVRQDRIEAFKKGLRRG